ncbi:Lactose permease [Talaromyces pinophilus]|nr:Lactose permease [Talaromyces pinophilus]
MLLNTKTLSFCSCYRSLAEDEYFRAKVPVQQAALQLTSCNGLMVAVAVVNSMWTLGYDSMMMNGLNILPSYTDYFTLTTATIGLNNAAAWIGNFLSCFVMQWFSDRFGRKNIIFIAAIVCFVGIIIQTAAQNVAMFVVGRIIVRFGAELTSAAAPALLGETLPGAQRGPILGLFFSCFKAGGLLASTITYGTQFIESTWDWRLPSILQCLPSALCVALLPFVPESPRWLVANGRHEEGLEILRIFEGAERAEELKSEMEAVIETERLSTNKILGLGSSQQKQTATEHLLRLALDYTPAEPYLLSHRYYLGTMLNLAGITNSTTQLRVNVILSCWCLFTSLVGSLLVDKLGRRVQAMGSITFCISMLFLFGGLASKYGTGSIDNSGIYGTIAALFLFQGSYAFAITPLTSLYPTEIFPYHVRRTGAALFRFADTGFGLMASFTMVYAMKNLGWKFYMVNGAYDFVFLACVYFFWVETKGVDLEEIAAGCKDLGIIAIEGEQRTTVIEEGTHFNEKPHQI